MNPLLHDLYYGRISPWERTILRSAEQREAENKITAAQRYFQSKLSAEEAERLQELEGLYTTVFSLEQADTFSYGFRLGAALMVEVLTGKSLANET